MRTQLINYIIYLVVLFLVLSCNSNKKENNNEKLTVKIGKKTVNIPFSFTVSEQVISERIWKNINTDLEFTINNNYDTTLYFPSKMCTDKNQNIFILDPPDYSIKKFSAKGKLIQKYGRKGKGPGEFIGSNTIDVDQNGVLVVLDPNIGKCEVFENSLSFSVKLLYQPINVCFTSKDRIAVLQLISPFDHSIIMEYDYKRESVNEFENIFETNELDDIQLSMMPILQGKIFRTSLNGVVYLPKFMNFFIVFSNKGEIIGAYRYITPTKNYVSEFNSRTNIDFRLPKEYQSYIGVGITKNRLISLSLKAKKEFGVFVADYYSLNDGKYLFSTKLNELEGFGHLHISENRIIYSKDHNEVNVLSYNIVD